MQKNEIRNDGNCKWRGLGWLGRADPFSRRGGEGRGGGEGAGGEGGGGGGGVKSVIPASAVTCPTRQCMMSICSRF